MEPFLEEFVTFTIAAFHLEIIPAWCYKNQNMDFSKTIPLVNAD